MATRRRAETISGRGVSLCIAAWAPASRATSAMSSLALRGTTGVPGLRLMISGTSFAPSPSGNDRSTSARSKG
jgi:hypothetical protein